MNRKILFTVGKKEVKDNFSYNVHKVITGDVIYDDVLVNDKILERVITMGYNKNR